MIEDELVKLWQSSPNQERIKFDKSRLMLDVQSGIDRLERAIKYRDLRETLAVAIVGPFFIYMGYIIPSVLTKIGSGLIVLYGIFVVLWLNRAKKHKPGPLSSTYLEYLRKAKQYLDAQKHLLDTVLYWYILPAYVSMSVFMLGSGTHEVIIRMQIGLIALCVAIYYLNKRAVTKTLVPKLVKIEAAIRVMEQEL
jgi:hypothetical protein